MESIVRISVSLSRRSLGEGGSVVRFILLRRDCRSNLMVVRGMDFAQSGGMRLYSVLVILLFAASVEARIGETSIQFVDRYGRPRDTAADKSPMFPLVEGAIHHTYQYHGWKIRAAFLQLDGPAVRMDFSKLPNGQNPRVQDYELEAIRAANTPAGMTWEQILYNNPDSPNGPLAKLGEAYFASAMGEKMWQRTDGAILWLRSHLIARLELPAARQHEEQLKIRKEQKARASVPQF
jgi:hypothetical protein